VKYKKYANLNNLFLSFFPASKNSFVGSKKKEKEFLPQFLDTSSKQLLLSKTKLLIVSVEKILKVKRNVLKL